MSTKKLSWSTVLPPMEPPARELRDDARRPRQLAELAETFDLWQARSGLRLAFYQALTAQEREAVYSTSLREIGGVIRILQDREREGEGSKFDRLRTERERAELLAEVALIRADAELERSRIVAFLPPATQVTAVAGQMETTLLSPDSAELARRALSRREDYRSEQSSLEQFRLEQRAADRLRIPEPVLSAGLKRADVGQGRIANGPVVGLSIPLPLFNKGQTEIARYSAEQERVSARIQSLAQQIRASIEGTVKAFQVRTQARDNYRRELADSGPELIKIAMIAYQEGEIGILQLLDAYRSQRQAQLRMLEIQLAVKEAQIELERVGGEELGQ